MIIPFQTIARSSIARYIKAAPKYFDRTTTFCFTSPLSSSNRCISYSYNSSSSSSSSSSSNNSNISSKTTSRMAKTVEEALQNGKLFTDDQVYTFLKLPIASVGIATALISKSSSSSSFRGLLIDKDEITIMIPSQDYQQYSQEMLDKGVHDGHSHDIEVGKFCYRLITFDAILDPTLIGFMATITKALAADNISVLPFAAYSRDHIFVQEDDFEKAMQVLKDLSSSSASAS